MICARNRLVQTEPGKTLQMRGITVHQDDYVIVDRCGTVLILAKHIEEVLNFGEKIDHRQSLMVHAVHAGQPVSEVMHGKQFETIRRLNQI